MAHDVTPTIDPLAMHLPLENGGGNGGSPMPMGGPGRDRGGGSAGTHTGPNGELTLPLDAHPSMRPEDQ